MTFVSRSIVLGVLGVVVARSSLLSYSAAAQSSRTPPGPKSHVAHAVKGPGTPKAINAEELQGLLKRDGSRSLLVNYWATWCDPCREEFPDLVKIDDEYRAKGLDFIAISLDDLTDINTEVPKFLRTMKAKMPVYLLNVPDPEPVINAVDPRWGGAMPATFLYNPKGEVFYKCFGRVKTDELRAAIEKLVGTRQ